MLQRQLNCTRFILAGALLLPSLGCAHFFDPCANTPLKQVTSPDGTLVLATYHRECRSVVLTVAAVEKPAGTFGSRGEVVCYLMSWGDRYVVDAVWTSPSAISVTTTDRMEKADFQDSQTACSGISVSYNVQFRNEQQRTDDPDVIARIGSTLSEVGPCINSYYKAGSLSNDPAAHMSELIDRGEHRSAVELLMAYAADAGCALSPTTYETLRSLSNTFDLKPGYLARVAYLVRS